MEKMEFEDDMIPPNVARFLRNQKREEVVRIIEKSDSPRMDDDEMRQVEPGQYFPWYQFIR